MAIVSRCFLGCSFNVEDHSLDSLTFFNSHAATTVTNNCKIDDMPEKQKKKNCLCACMCVCVCTIQKCAKTYAYMSRLLAVPSTTSNKKVTMTNSPIGNNYPLRHCSNLVSSWPALLPSTTLLLSGRLVLSVSRPASQPV